MRIAILYICTGRYTIFWPEFYASCEEFFFKGHAKEYFVFTDGALKYSSIDNVHRIEQKRLGWPYDTLQRFNLFRSQERLLEKFDLIFFCNANIEFMQQVDQKILPKDECSIIVTQHPGYVDKKECDFPFERDQRSLAYIGYGRGEVYACGGFNGGYTSAYLRMITTLSDNIEADLNNGIIARWHDESHLNRYIQDHPYHLLPVSYCYPQYEIFREKEIVRIRDKACFGGSSMLRDQPRVLRVRLKDQLRYFAGKSGLLPYLRHIRKMLKIR